VPDTFVKIASVTVGSGGAASIDFTSIPSTYTDLCLLTSLRSSTTQAWAKLQINGSDSNFTSRSLEGYGSGTPESYSRTDNLNFIALDKSSYTSNTFSNSSLYFPNYAGSNYKSISVDSVAENNATEGIAVLFAKLWSSTSAINQLTIVPQSGTLVQYSTATLYGIKSS
jgi:hypothetical protein